MMERVGPLRRSARTALLSAAVLLVATASGAAGQSNGDPTPFPGGKGVTEADLDGTELDLWTYKPDGYVGDGFILLLHGASRAAEAYRDNAAGFADTYNRMVVVPYFDSDRFPNRRYQQGGVFREDDSFADPDERTFAYIPKIVQEIRDREGDEDLPYIVLGYSAGGQFVARMSAFLDLDAERLVSMSPGSTMFPTRELDYGLGFGDLPEEYSNDERLQRYLALPLTVAIGTEDVESRALPRGDAFEQGVHRYARNLRWFNTAMELAHEREWEFNWRLVIAHGAGHPPVEMFDHPQIGNALFGHRDTR